MGTKYGFRCSKCGYSATVCGGVDSGLIAVVRTMACSDCKEIVDVLVGKWGQEGPTGDPSYDKDLNVCPNCNRRRVRPWSLDRSCPRCEHRMILNPDVPKVHWD
jgi:hypothetical protein